MVERSALAFVLVTAVLAWLLAVTATDGWDEPAILFWAALLTFGGAAVLVAVELSDLPV